MRIPVAVRQLAVFINLNAEHIPVILLNVLYKCPKCVSGYRPFPHHQNVICIGSVIIFIRVRNPAALLEAKAFVKMIGAIISANHGEL